MIRYQEILSSVSNSVIFTFYTLLNIMRVMQFFITDHIESNTLHRCQDTRYVTRIKSETSTQHRITVHSSDNIRYHCATTVYFVLYIRSTKVPDQRYYLDLHIDVQVPSLEEAKRR
jgi:hypothetical protein